MQNNIIIFIMKHMQKKKGNSEVEIQKVGVKIHDVFRIIRKKKEINLNFGFQKR